MRFAARTRVPYYVLFVFTSVLAISLSGSAAGQRAAAPAAGTPPATAAPAAAAPPAADATSAAAPAEGSSKELLEKGNAALKAGDYQAAVTAFQAAFRSTDQASGIEGLRDRTAAVVGRARALAGMKEYTAALNDLGAIISDDPNNPNAVPAMVARGQILLDQPGRTEDALVDFENAVKLDSANIDAQFGLGKTQVYLNKADEAISPLTHAIAGDPKNGEAFRLRGVAYSALYKIKQAIEDLQQAIAVNPDDYEAYFSLGAVKFRLDDFQAAVELFGKALEHYKPKPGQEDVPYVQGYLSRSTAYIELGKAAKDPAAKKAAYQGAFAEAQKIASQLEPKNPLHVKALASALSSRGVAERMLGQLGTAIRSLTQSIELRSTMPPDDSTNEILSDAYFRRGICFHLIGEDRMAIGDFQASAHLVTGDPRADLWEGFTYAKLGDYHQALRAYGDAIAASDRFTYAYYNRALTYMMLGDYNKAVADFNDAIRLDPVNAEYYFKRGVAYQQLGDNQKASESFASSLEFDNKHAGTYRHMADAMQALGRTELVTQYRQKADQLAPPKKSP